MVNLFTKCITCCSCFFLTYKPTTGYYRRSLLNLESNSSYYNILFINNTNLYNNYPLSFVKLTAPLQKAFCHFIRMGCLISTQLRKKLIRLIVILQAILFQSDINQNYICHDTADQVSKSEFLLTAFLDW